MSEGFTMRTILVGGAATVSLCLTASALAQDHAGHEMASSPESSAHSMSEGQAEQGEKMGSGVIEHSGMDHNVMDHEPMSGTDAIAGVGSGTARLPANESMPQIGRASGRERVCGDDEISVVAVRLKTKNKVKGCVIVIY